MRRIEATQLRQRLEHGERLLLLDVRRSEAFRRQPMGIPGAVPLLLDGPAPQIPDVSRTTPVVAYCLCSGQASSTRAALWLQAAGYEDVSVLEGGLPGWQGAKLPTAPITLADRARIAAWRVPPAPAASVAGGRLIAENAFLSGEAVPAAFDLRAALAARRQREPDLLQARFALSTGPLVVGYVGSQERRSLTFIGPSVNVAARILKMAPPGGIAATEPIVRHAERTDPDLAARFRALPERQSLKGFDEPITVFVAAEDDSTGHLSCHDPGA